MHKVDWCEGGMKLADISTKNVGEHDLTPKINYMMVRIENWDRRGATELMIVYGKRVLYN